MRTSDRLVPADVGSCAMLLFLLLLSTSASATVRQPLIIDGYQSAEQSWPYMAALVTRSIPARGSRSRGWESFCGGSYIGGRWVLTAAHCVVDKKGRPVPSRSIKIHFGAGEPDSGNDLVSIAEVRIHPSFDLSTLASDIALIELEKRPPGVSAVAIPDPRQLEQAAISFAPAIILGRGAGRNSSSTTALFQADIQLIPEITCNDAFNSFKAAHNLSDGTLRTDPVDSTRICAGDLRGTSDTCLGDSGGPLLVELGNGYRLAGITSWGIGCGTPGVYGVYTKVPAHLGWLEEVTGLELTPADTQRTGVRGYPLLVRESETTGAGALGLWLMGLCWLRQLPGKGDFSPRKTFSRLMRY